MTDTTSDVPDRVFVDASDLPPLRNLASDIVNRATRAKSAIYTGMITTAGLESAKVDLIEAARAALDLHQLLQKLARHD